MKSLCSTPGCENVASQKCPLCLREGRDSFFCSQECFKNNYAEHKLKFHKPASTSASTVTSGILTGDAWSNVKFTGTLRPYAQSALRSVPALIGRPDYADNPLGFSKCEQDEKPGIRILNDEEIDGMRVACKLGREVLDECLAACAVGITTDQVDRIAHEACIERECYPSPLNYFGFPKSCCTSVNEVICHGIPDLRPLEFGDILNVDITVYHRGFHGDLNETIPIGQIDEGANKLIRVSWECLQKAINEVRPGFLYREIGPCIQKHADLNGFSVVRSYCGHGIHRLFHCHPVVPHYSRNKAIGVMKPGHVFTIEPMINEGTYQDDIWPDNWTAVTCDGKRSSQFEQTLLVTENGCDILTKRPTHDGLPWFMTKT